MDDDLTWSDIEQVMEGVSAQLLKDDGPMTERPSKRQRLAPVSTTNPKPAVEALPDVTWSGWVELADAMELNRTHGPRLVHGIAQLYAKQQHYLALPSEQRPQSAPAVDAELQWLKAVLELAQMDDDGAQPSGQAEIGQQQQPRQPRETARPSGGSVARQPLQQQCPDGFPSATQCLGSEAENLVCIGDVAVPYTILGRDWQARGNRGPEVMYLVQYQGHAEGEEEWVMARKLEQAPGGKALIAEYDRALDAGELDASQQQSQADNPGAATRASQQSQQMAPSLPAIPESAPCQLHTNGSAPAENARQRPHRQQRETQQQQQQLVEGAQPQAQQTRTPRLPRDQPAAHVANADPADRRQPRQPPVAVPAASKPAAPEQQAPAPVPQRSEGGTGQDQALFHMPPSQPHTNSQWLAAETQTQAPGLSGPTAMDFIPFTQGSQPARAGDGAHRQPLPAQPAAVAARAATGSAPTAPAAGAAAAAPQSGLAPTSAAAADPAAPIDRPLAGTADGRTVDRAQAASGLAIPQDGQAASGADEDSALPDERTQRGVQQLLRRLSAPAASPAQVPQLMAQAQQHPSAQPVAQPEQQPEQQARNSTPSEAAPAGDAGGTVADAQSEQQVAASGPGAAHVGSGAAAAAAPGGAAPSSPAISLSSAEEDEDPRVLQLKAHLQQDKWTGARITGAKRLDAGMVISVKWDDGFKASVPNDMLKAKEHCHLKLIEFYESKIKPVTRTKKTVDVTDAAPAEV